MFRRILVAAFTILTLAACEKKTPVVPEIPQQSQQIIITEPVQTLARDTAQKVKDVLSNSGLSSIEFETLKSHDIFPDEAFSYFEKALVANLASLGILKTAGIVKLHGDLSRQHGEILFSFRIFRDGDQIHSGSSSIPDDQRLQTTLAQFEAAGAPAAHDHTGHKDMPVPTPLAQLKRIPMDSAEHCPDQEQDCSLLLLFPNELVQRNWKEGTERAFPLERTGIRSRAPSGKILKIQNNIFLFTNELQGPVVYDQNLQPIRANVPSRFPLPEPGRNTYSLADGRFFDFEPFHAKGLAVVDLQNRLSLADEGKLATAGEPAGSTLHVSPPYIYTSSPVLPGAGQDSILKFIYKDGLLRLEASQKMDGSIYDILLTDLNRDGQKELLVTVMNSRGIFIEVHEDF